VARDRCAVNVTCHYRSSHSRGVGFGICLYNLSRAVQFVNSRRIQVTTESDRHAGTFGKHPTIAVHTVDLARIQSVFRLAERHHYTVPIYFSSHLLNARVTFFVGINYFLAIKELLTDCVKVTVPVYYMQGVGSSVKMGWGGYGSATSLGTMSCSEF